MKKFLEEIKDKNIEAIIFCGDLISPFTTGVLAEANIATYCVLGNNDEDHIGILDFCHYPKLGELLAKSGNYNAVFYGHTYITRNEKIANTLLMTSSPA